MRKIILILTVISFVSCAGVTNKQNQIKKTEINAITEFEFEEEIHNFGDLNSGEIVVFTYIFTNTGEANLNIKDIKVDCGCLKVNFSKEGVKPGEKGLIEIEFDSSGLFGKQFKSIEVNANTKEPKQLAIFAAVKNEQIEIKY